MIDFFKTLIAERIVIKIVGFIFALGVIPVLVFFYGLDEEPKWVSTDKHYLKYDFALTIKVPLKLFDLQKNEQFLKKSAKKEFKKEIYSRALKQIKVSYDWNTLDDRTQKILIQTLDDEFSKINFNDIKEQSIYEDDLHFLIYGLYSMKNSEIDVVLQGIYKIINTKIRGEQL